MIPSSPKIEYDRRTGKHQVDEQRIKILDAAEKLFLQNGLEKTSMIDIARQAGINKVTLYRYFQNRDVIAVEIHVRMLSKINALVASEGPEVSSNDAKKKARAMIRNFSSLRDAYRFIGMFDKLYLDNPPDAALTQWTKNRLIPLLWNEESIDEMLHRNPLGNRYVMVMSTVIWFLEKLALRGELTWSDSSIPLEEHLMLFEEMIIGYLEQISNPQDSDGSNS
jgi:AcrR family transcriptional regulator